MAKIVILGGGFAAMAAAEMLSKAAGEEHEITLVSQNANFVFYPALVPLVFGDFDPQEIKFDLRPILADRKIRFINGEVLKIDPDDRSVTVTGDDIEGSVHFDHLIVGLGRRLATERVPGFFENAQHLLTVDAALRFKQAVSSFKSGAIVVGLCPNGLLPVPVCEAALALAKRFKDQIADGSISVTAVFPSSLDKAFAGSALFRNIEEDFRTNGIQLVSDFAIAKITDASLISAHGGEIHHDLLMLVPPFRGQTPVQHLSPVTDDTGFAHVNERMQVKGLEHIYAAGDIVSIPGPRFGYMAIRQGKVAALNVLAELSDEEPKAEYSHKIEWAIGEKYTDPVFFHYGFWDDTLDDFDEDAFFGMAKRLRDRYGTIISARGAAKTISSR